MLENEPDTEQRSTPDSPPPPRRRRAASRPAGPPASAADAPPIEHPGSVAEPPSTPPDQPPAPEAMPADPMPADPIPAADPGPAAEPVEAAAQTEPSVEPTAKKAAAKRPARKTTAKKAASADPDQSPPARAPRKRTAKKTAPAPAAEESADEVIAEVAIVDPEVALEAEPVRPERPTPAEPQAIEPEAIEPAEPVEFGAVEPVEPEAVDIAPEPDTEAAETLQPELTEAEAAQAVPPAPEPEADEPETVEPEAAETEDTDSEGDGRRRRRRRGGRRRRRGGSDDEASSDDEPEAEVDRSVESAISDLLAQPTEQQSPAATEDEAAEGDTDSDTDGEGDGQRRRRRRRRRRGEDSGAAANEPTDVVVRVREPRRSSKSNNNEVTGIEGSTRMEAKRQRRREGRDAGRRRPPILSEAEFLARRESVARKMIIRQRDDLTQIAVIEDDILVEHYVDRDSAASLIGNVYLGRVQNVLPSMEAAFVDIGRGRNAVLYAGEVDWDSFGAEGQNRKVEKVLKSGQTILVQVSKDPVGAKGARLTNHVSIPGRYIVYAPGGHLSGISRKLPDVERKRLKDILAELVGESASVIVRTAAEGASEEELVRDVNRLQAQWADIERKVAAGQSPQLLYGEPDLTVRIVRDLFTEDFAELIIAGNGGQNDAYDAIEGYVTHVAPHLKERMRRWEPEDGRDVFAEYRLDEQIAKALERKVFLPSGGSLIIERTEAMTVIDVNTGKFTGTGGNLEATVTSNNLEAAEEIVRQLRLRDIGGIIVIDFIDMVLPNNRELLLRRLVECLGRDRTRHQVAEVTSLGLVQMTRKKIGTGLLEAFTTECPHCHGRGVELHEMPVESQKQPDGGTREPNPPRRSGGRAPSPARARRNTPAREAEGSSAPEGEPVPVS
ncbi:MAG TPA: Rne/Rng family ribonuclease [Propionibacteriaceae bacterium]|nr:Rne/Rng family ribonuclease [Propionibacteriaceae bacterium]